MTFPVIFHILGRDVPAHAVLELGAYLTGMQTYLLIRRRDQSLSIHPEKILWLIVFCVVGALLGSKILAWLESAPEYWAARADPRSWLGGKTIVGGLLGGWVGVEIGKRRFGITARTGDAYVLPLTMGIAIGRVGCFLTGLPDHTHGIATSLPWGIDFGDGIRRHPTQLYEIVFVLILGIVIRLRSGRPHMPGDLFRRFMLGYFLFRFIVEFIKPRYTILGLSMIQIASIAGVIWALAQLLPKATELPEGHRV